MGKDLKNITLLYFAEEFSTAKAEQFIEQELNSLAPHFKQIHVFVFKNNISDCKYTLAGNIKVIDFNLYEAYSRKQLVGAKLFTLINLYVKQLFLSQHKGAYVKKCRFYFNWLMNNLNAAIRLTKLIASSYKKGSYVVESFWFNRWVFVLSLAKHLSPQLLPAINTRTHGGDYDETQTGSFFPFRSLQMKYVDHILPVSIYGENYLKNKYPAYKGIIEHAYLGVKDNGLGPVNNTNGFHLLSCSSLIPLKRVHLIIDILQNCKEVITWTHFGDGPLKGEVLQKAKQLPAHIAVDFKGHVPNHEFLNFLKTNSVDLFINVSESEGLPVTLMEAISFGIPILATDVGGVKDIACKETGYLIAKDFNATETASIISAFIKKSKEDVLNLRKTARAYFEEHFNSDKNYKQFLETIF